MQTLTTKSILALLNEEQQLELLNVLDSKITREKNIRDKLGELETKYFDLVWMARSTSKDPKIRKIFKEISAKYPGELDKLKSEEGLAARIQQWHVSLCQTFIRICSAL